MRHLILALLLAAGAAVADNATIVGQGILTEQRIGWGSNVSSSLYIAGATGYLRDSSTSRVAMDTSASSVGDAGACSQTITIRTGSAVTPQLRCELSYRVRTTDVGADGFNIYIASRYRVPVGTDSGWVLPGNAYYLDSNIVNQTHSDPGATTSFTTRLVNFYPSGQDARVCIERTASGSPGAGDTLVFNNNWLRCW